MEEINLKEFLGYLKKYILIILIVILVCIISVVTYNIALKTPKYTTYTTIVLVKNETNYESNTTIDQNDITLNQKLVATYRQIIKSKLVLQQVIDDLKLTYSVEQISKNISVQALEDTEILKISVTDEDPKTAVKIADDIANVFNKEVNQIYDINNVSVIDKAELPTEPSNNTLVRDVILAFIIAVVGSTAVIFVVYYFDDTLKNTEDIETELGVPIIAKVFKDHSKTDLVTAEKPKALASESIRTLRTNLQFSSIDSELKTILVTSTMPGEGKSFISANLAISFAQASKRVLLIDCDLRKGRQHDIFGLANKEGLSNLLIEDVMNFSSYVNKTNIPNLYVITRGIFPPNPAELLSSKKNIMLLDILKERFDVIILDSAPCYNMSDALILSSLVDKVILVSSAGYTPKTVLKNTIKSLQNVGGKIAGCIINNISTKNSTYGRYYDYGYYYGEKKEEHPIKTNIISKELPRPEKREESVIEPIPEQITIKEETPVIEEQTIITDGMEEKPIEEEIKEENNELEITKKIEQEINKDSKKPKKGNKN